MEMNVKTKMKKAKFEHVEDEKMNRWKTKTRCPHSPGFDNKTKTHGIEMRAK